MITRLEIDGFKSFYNFSVDLKPFQVVIGPNGVGKSNLFDAIRLLSDVVRHDRVSEAFLQNRGEVGEQFARQPDGSAATQIRLAAEMLISKRTTDERLGGEAEVTSTRLRYEVTIANQRENGLSLLRVVHESLEAITTDNDGWFQRNIPVATRPHWIQRGRRTPYISTDSRSIAKHQEGRSGRKQETPLGQIERTILSTVDTLDYPTAYAARQEMLNWRFVQFSPDGLRSPSSIYDNGEQLLPDGSNLAAVLFRMKNQDPALLTDVSRDMANAVTGVQRVDVEHRQERNVFVVVIYMRDGQRFTSQVISDGTLRLLALVTLRNDPNYRGVLTFEEPENGVAPQAMTQALRTLESLAADLDSNEDDVPSQVLVNSHSPSLLTNLPPETFLFTYMAGTKPRATRMVEITLTNQARLDPAERQQVLYTLDQVLAFMRAEPYHELFEELEQHRLGLVGA